MTAVVPWYAPVTCRTVHILTRKTPPTTLFLLFKYYTNLLDISHVPCIVDYTIWVGEEGEGRKAELTHASVGRMKVTLNYCCAVQSTKPCLSTQKTTQPSTIPGTKQQQQKCRTCSPGTGSSEYGILLVPVQQYHMYHTRTGTACCIW